MLAVSCILLCLLYCARLGNQAKQVAYIGLIKFPLFSCNEIAPSEQSSGAVVCSLS